MKFKLISLLTLTTIGAFFSVATIANQVSLLNTSPGYDTVKVTYRVAHKNPGEPTVFGALQTVDLLDKEMISFELEGYQLAGIVPLSIDGHRLPDAMNEFNKPKHCSLTTDKERNVGSLAITYTQLSNGHANISCTTNGGIFK